MYNNAMSVTLCETMVYWRRRPTNWVKDDDGCTWSGLRELLVVDEKGSLASAVALAADIEAGERVSGDGGR